MGEWLEQLVPWGTEVIVWIQSLSNDLLDAIFLFITFLGYQPFYFLALPLVYWCIDKPIGAGLGFASLLSAWTNSALKFVFKLPRPADARIRIPIPETTPSFPSGHAQNGVVFWGYLAYQATRSRSNARLLWVVAIALMLGLGISRVVLGVHYPQDVLGGWLIGVVLLVAYVTAEPGIRHWLGRQGILVQLALALGVPLILIFVHPVGLDGRYPEEDAITSMAAAAGFGIGIVMERSWVRFQVEGPWRQRVLRYVVGLAIVLLFYLGPALLLPDHWSQPVESIVCFLRYGLLAWAIAFLSPWIFVRLHLAKKNDVLPGDVQQRS